MQKRTQVNRERMGNENRNEIGLDVRLMRLSGVIIQFKFNIKNISNCILQQKTCKI